MARRGRRHLFTDHQLIELHEQCLNDREIGEKLGADRRTVGVNRRRLGLEPIRKHGIEAYRRRRLFTDQQLMELYEQGLNDGEIGEKLGADSVTVHTHRKRLGLKPISRRLFTDQQLIELYERGFNDREIGEKLGTSNITVNIHRRRLGLKAHGRVRAR